MTSAAVFLMHRERLADPYPSTHWKAWYMSTFGRTMGTSCQRYWLRDINLDVPDGYRCGAVDRSAWTSHLGYINSFEAAETSMEGKKVIHRADEARLEEQMGCYAFLVLLETQTFS